MTIARNALLRRSHRRLRTHVLALTLAATCVACMPKPGRLESNRFQHDRYPYAVFYVDGGGQETPLGPTWRVDNYVRGDRGRYELKDTPEHTIERAYALNDGRRAPFKRLEARYDLDLLHTQKEAELTVRTISLSTAASEPDLRVLAGRYADAIAAAGTLGPEFGPERTDSTGQSQPGRLDELSCTISQRDAYRIDFELPLSVGGRAKGPKRGSVVVVRSGYVERVTDGARGAAAYPVLLVLAIAAKPEDYAALEPDFLKLLDQTVLGDAGMGLSMKGGHTCVRGTSSGTEVPVAPSQETGS